MASKNITLQVRRTGCTGFDIVVFVDQNPSAQDDAASLLNECLMKPNANEWLLGKYPWRVNYEVGISGCFFSAIPKDGQIIIAEWIKKCTAKFGKNLTVENGAKQ